MLNKRLSLVFIIYISVLSLVTCLLFVYPDNWILPLPLAALFGPIMLIRLGYGSIATSFLSEGIITVLVVSIFIMAIGFKTNWITISLFVFGVLLWLIIGAMAGQILYV
jgi:hypothetical protein